MILYVEKHIREHHITQNILANFPNAQILEIDHYKNIFDFPISGKIEKSYIIASVKNAILPAPVWYGHAGWGYFLKNSLNCIYDCQYCYLKGAFKNDIPVFFVNYDDMKLQILQTLKKHDPNETVRFYSSDYSDNLATNTFTQFCEYFIPFFDTLPNAKMEIRTKSVHIAPLLKISPSKNVEIAFSLNPAEIIQKYELRTPKLDMRIQAINTLLDASWQVGIRFIPLLEVENYREIYTEFLEKVTQKIDFSRIYSVFIGGLLYTKKDYSKMLQKLPYLDILYTLEKGNDGFVREKPEIRNWFYELFDRYITQQECQRCLEE